MSSTILLPPRAKLCIRYCSNKQQRVASFEIGTAVINTDTSQRPVRNGQTSQHSPRLVVSHNTCPPLSPSPRKQLYNMYCSNKHTPVGARTRFCGCGSPRGDLSHIANLTPGWSRSDFSGAFEELKICCLSKVCMFITTVPDTKLCAWGEEDSGVTSGGHVL
jgi:hypothetical protein